jgi:hypothetical protein
MGWLRLLRAAENGLLSFNDRAFCVKPKKLRNRDERTQRKWFQWAISPSR